MSAKPREEHRDLPTIFEIGAAEFLGQDYFLTIYQTDVKPHDERRKDQSRANQLINVAIAEKLSALRTESYFENGLPVQTFPRRSKS